MLELYQNTLPIGEIFIKGDVEWVVISKYLAISKDLIGKQPFRKDYRADDANVYKKSDIKKFIEEWASERNIIAA